MKLGAPGRVEARPMRPKTIAFQEVPHLGD